MTSFVSTLGRRAGQLRNGLLAASLGMAAIAGPTTGCAPTDREGVQLHGQVRLTLLHTSDIHSRLFPYAFQIGQADAMLGLGAPNTVSVVGGAPQVSYLVNRERARSERSLHLDSGDVFQGAPVFNFFHGEAEAKFMSYMGTEAMVVGNHEFDLGTLNAVIQFTDSSNFPMLAANYLIDDPREDGKPQAGRLLYPFTVINAQGLRVGIIGMGDLSSMTSLFERPNKLGMQPLNTVETAQAYVDLVRPYVDVIVMLTHLGINSDVSMVRGTTGIDVVLGGHNHIVLQPPKIVEDCSLVDESGNHFIELADTAAIDENGHASKKRRYCEPRKVIVAHSGAFAKFVGRLDLVLSDDRRDVSESYDPNNAFEVLSHDYRLFPVTEDTPRDPNVTAVLEPYAQELDRLIDLDLLIGYAPDLVRRMAANGGDAPLGNMVATAALLRVGIQTDFALTNTLGIRADMVPGPVSIEQMFNIFPFENSLTKMQLSGVEVRDLFDFVARRSAGRGCKSQAQIAGARVVLNCGKCSRPDVAQTCTINEDCTSNRCILSTGVCEPPACADEIYIGATDRQCTSDSQCPEGRIGSCDTVNIDANQMGRCWQPLNLIASYELATSNYLAQGGSGFRVLQRNTTQADSKVQQRDALIDYVRAGKPCGYRAEFDTPEGLKRCSTEADCASLGTEYTCTCPEVVAEDPISGKCSTAGTCDGAAGRCVLTGCRDGVADFRRQVCAEAASPAIQESCERGLGACQQAGEVCKFLACIDPSMGAYSDNRLYMLGR